MYSSSLTTNCFSHWCIPYSIVIISFPILMLDWNSSCLMRTRLNHHNDAIYFPFWIVDRRGQTDGGGQQKFSHCAIRRDDVPAFREQPEEPKTSLLASQPESERGRERKKKRETERNDQVNLEQFGSKFETIGCWIVFKGNNKRDVAFHQKWGRVVVKYSASEGASQCTSCCINGLSSTNNNPFFHNHVKCIQSKLL